MLCNVSCLSFKGLYCRVVHLLLVHGDLFVLFSHTNFLRGIVVSPLLLIFLLPHVVLSAVYK